MKIYDVVILGGGASGLMCAAFLDKNLDVAIIEKNNQFAKKLKISGGGKCNITNTSVSLDNFEGDELLVSTILDSFSKDNLLDFLDAEGIELELRKNRYYFCKNSSDDIIDVLKNKIKNVDKFLGEDVVDVVKTDNLFEIKTTHDVYEAKRIVVATGGKSFAQLGATDIGLQIAKKFDIKVREFTPALVGLTLQKEQFWMKELSGLSFYVHIKVADKIIKEDMLFAHKGISGPAVLSASLFWKNGMIGIDFLPNYRVVDVIQKGKNKLLSSAIPLPKRFLKTFLNAMGIEDTECKKVTKDMIDRLEVIHNYKFAPAGNFGFSKAEVSSGGVLADELNIISLESVKVNGLHFIGEIVDVTGELGGYNFQWAFSSAISCARAINSEII